MVCVPHVPKPWHCPLSPPAMSLASPLLPRPQKQDTGQGTVSGDTQGPPQAAGHTLRPYKGLFGGTFAPSVPVLSPPGDTGGELRVPRGPLGVPEAGVEAPRGGQRRVSRLSMYSCSACSRASISASSAEGSSEQFSLGGGGRDKGKWVKNRPKSGWGTPGKCTGALTFPRALAGYAAHGRLAASSRAGGLGREGGGGGGTGVLSPHLGGETPQSWGGESGGGVPGIWGGHSPRRGCSKIRYSGLSGRGSPSCLCPTEGGGVKGCWGGRGSKHPAPHPTPPRCPPPRRLPGGQGLGPLISFTAGTHRRAPAPEAFGCGEKWELGGGGGRRSPSTQWVLPPPRVPPHSHPSAHPHSPEELRPRLLTGLALPKAAPCRWLHPRETVVKGRGGAEGGQGTGTVTTPMSPLTF